MNEESLEISMYTVVSNLTYLKPSSYPNYPKLIKPTSNLILTFSYHHDQSDSTPESRQARIKSFEELLNRATSDKIFQRRT